MRRLKDYRYLNKFGKERSADYVIFAIVFTTMSVCLVMNKFETFDYTFFLSLFLTLVFSSLFWLPLIIKNELYKMRLKKFSDDELVMMENAISETSETDNYCIAGDILIIFYEKIKFIRIRDILWIYCEHTHMTRKMFGLTYSTSDLYGTTVISKNGEVLCDTRFIDLQQLYTKLVPYNDEIIYGYTKEARIFVQEYLDIMASKYGKQRKRVWWLK